MSKADSHLSIQNLRVVYQTTRGELEAVRQFDIEMGRNEFIAILGPSGCGKSTLLQIVSGLLAPTSGKVLIAGEEVTRPRRDVGIVFQQATLLPWKTVLENVLVPIRAMRLPVADYRDKALALLKSVGLEKFAGYYPHELSGGMQQRVGIARGIIHDPAVILMDEPFAALDAMTREYMSLDLQSLWMREQKSIVFITHSIPEAVFLADRVVVMSGRPSKILEIVDVDIPRPRRLETMADSRFAEIASHLRKTFAEMRE